MAATSDLRLSPIHLLTGLPCAEAAEAPSPSRAEEEDGDGGGAGSPPGSPGGSSRAERGAGEGGAGRSREGLGQRGGGRRMVGAVGGLGGVVDAEVDDSTQG